MTAPATIESESPPKVHSGAIGEPSRGRASVWLRWIFLLIAVFVAINLGGSWLVQHTRIRQILNARLAAAFGRPVEVGRYSLTLWDGPALVAEPITVAEDPRFGHEYFLRADALTIRLRWLSLFSGQLELGTLSLSRPSLNFVRAADGRWNIEEWLPAPSSGIQSLAAGRAVPRAAPGIKGIEVDSGRVNFKRGDEKLPFAFVDLSGSVEQDSPGHWQVNLDASPTRAAVVLQQAGTVHVDGELGGTSSRLRPANLHIRWQDAALADAFRLGAGTDHGIRGGFMLALDAQTQGAAWNLQGRVELRRLHRWDLSLRADNPGVNVLLRADWLPEASTLNFSDITVQAPRSSAHGSGVVTWADTAAPTDRGLNVSSDGIDCADVLAWVRAFHPAVSEALTAHGTLRFNIALAGWPLRPAGGTASTDGATLEGGSLRVPLKMARSSMQFDRRSAHLLPVTIQIGSDDGVLRAEAAIPADSTSDSTWKLSGKSANVEDLTDAATALGWNAQGGWKLEGPAAFDLGWQGREKFPWKQTFGKVELQGLTLHAPYLNQPISRIQGKLNFARESSQLRIDSALAFGGEWKGTVDLFPAAGPRQFAFSVDRLNSEDLDRWLNPRWREGFLGNILPFLNSSTSGQPAPGNLEAQGHVAIDQFAFLRFVVHRLKGELAIHGRRLELDNADADFYGAHVSGKLVADLQKAPMYNVKAHFSGLNLSSLTASSPTLAKTFGGQASGDLALTLSGVGRDALLASLECDGSTDIQNPSLEGFDLINSLHSEERIPGTTSFTRALGAFKCRKNKIQISQLRLIRPDAALSLSGSVDTAHNLELRVHWINDPSKGGEPSGAVAPSAFQIDGSLAEPRVSTPGTTPKE
ncbi:MAG: AsmA family protein [Candidatus Acidiferrales bacterium]